MPTRTDFFKTAQTWGYFAPSHNTSSAKEWHKTYTPIADNVIKAPVRAVSSVAGAAIGAGKAWLDTLGRTGFGSGPGWWAAQYLHPKLRPDIGVYADAGDQILRGAGVGAKIGWRDADRVAHDAITTAAMVGSDLGLVSDDKANRIRLDNDRKMLEQMRRSKVSMPDRPTIDPETGLLVATGSPEYKDYDKFVNWARGGQGISRAALDAASLMSGTNAMGATGRLVADAARMSPAAASRLSTAAAAIPMSAQIAKDIDRGIDSGGRNADRKNLEEYNKIVNFMGKMDPSSPEYKKLYDVMRKFSKIDGKSFASITQPIMPEPSNSGSDIVQERPTERWSMSPELQNVMGYGLGGLGLGSILGGWKLGLLGLLLGAMHGGVGIGNIWKNISKSWNSANMRS